MNIRRSAWGIVAVAAILPVSAMAEITAIRGAVEVVIQEIRFNVDGDRDEVFEIFPDTSSVLPLQVVGELVASGSELARARAAAQFADPRDLSQPNPEEFAINLALNSLTPNTRYEVRARAEETRDIIFQPGELGDAVEGVEHRRAVGHVARDRQRADPFAVFLDVRDDHGVGIFRSGDRLARDQGAEAPAERRLGVLVQILAGETQHQILVPGCHDLPEYFVVDRLAEIDAANLGAQRRRHGMHRNRHRVLPDRCLQPKS